MGMVQPPPWSKFLVILQAAGARDPAGREIGGDAPAGDGEVGGVRRATARRRDSGDPAQQHVDALAEEGQGEVRIGLERELTLRPHIDHRQRQGRGNRREAAAGLEGLAALLLLARGRQALALLFLLLLRDRLVERLGAVFGQRRGRVADRPCRTRWTRAGRRRSPARRSCRSGWPRAGRFRPRSA